MKGTEPRDFRLQVFSWISISHYGRFIIFSKIRGDIHSGGYFANGISDTSSIGGQFAVGVVDTGSAPRPANI